MFRELILLSVLFVLISAYPNEYPSNEFANKPDLCGALLPNALINGFAPQPSNTNPYRIFASSETYTPGQKITVKISGDESIAVLIQPLDVTTNQTIGQWLWQWHTQDNCNVLFLHHFIYFSRPHGTSDVTIPWKAPDTFGKVYFKGIVMKQFDNHNSTFWSGIVSQLE